MSRDQGSTSVFTRRPWHLQQSTYCVGQGSVHKHPANTVPYFLSDMRAFMMLAPCSVCSVNSFFCLCTRLSTRGMHE